jgi:hypothetical protein
MKDVQELLLRRVGELLTPLGFRARTRAQSYRRDIPHGQWALHLSFIRHEADFDVTADVAIRFDAVEERLHRDDKLLAASEKRETATLGAELGNIERGEPHRWTVAEISDVAVVAPSIVAKFEQTGLPYLDRLSDPLRALEALTRNDGSEWLYSPFPGSRCKAAATLAALYSNKARFAEVVSRCIASLRTHDERELASFQNYIVSLSPPEH